MLPADLRRNLRELGWSQAQFSKRIRVNKNTISKWMLRRDDSGNEVPIPGPVAAYVELALRVKGLAAGL